MNNQATKQPEANTHPLRATWYDRAASWLLSSLLIAGLSVAVLVVAWFSYPRDGMKEDGKRRKKPPTEFALENAKEITPLSGGTQLKRPSDEPLAANEITDVDIRRDLAVLEESAKKAVQLTGLSMDDGPGVFGEPGPGRGPGDPDGGGIKPLNWEVQFDKTSLAVYARQLDFFKIELGVLLPDGKLAYVYNLSKPKPDTRINNNPHETETRYYLTWQKGGLKQADQELLARAGIDTAKPLIIVKFLPDQLVEQLKVLEKTAAGSDKKIVKTRFGIRTNGNGYAVFVLEQTYKP